MAQNSAPNGHLSSTSDLANLLKEKQVFLFDCDGVIWNDDSLIDGAKELIVKLKSAGRHVFLVTNNSTKSRAQYMSKCSKLGLPVVESEIVCTAAVAAGYISQLKLPGVTYVIGSPGLQDEMTLHGVACCGFREDDACDHGHGFEQFADVPLRSDVSAVLLALDTRFNYLKLLKAASYVSSGALFLGSNEDAFLPSATSAVRLPGTGSMLDALRTATQSQPAAVMGKPHRPMLDYVVGLLGASSQTPPTFDRWLMVGDRLDTDIAFGRRHGIDAVCVMTGCTTPEDLTAATADAKLSELRPTAVMESVADFLPHLGD